MQVAAYVAYRPERGWSTLSPWYYWVGAPDGTKYAQGRLPSKYLAKSEINDRMKAARKWLRTR